MVLCHESVLDLFLQMTSFSFFLMMSFPLSFKTEFSVIASTNLSSIPQVELKSLLLGLLINLCIHHLWPLNNLHLKFTDLSTSAHYSLNAQGIFLIIFLIPLFSEYLHLRAQYMVGTC